MITKEYVEYLGSLDPNIPKIMKVLETLPKNSDAYFYMSNLLINYIAVLEEQSELREQIKTYNGGA